VTSDRSNDRDIARRNQLVRYAEAILHGATEEGAHEIHFVPEKDDVAVFFITPGYEPRRVMSIPIASFAELWRIALAPGFTTGQHVMNVGDTYYLFRLKEGRMALGEEVTIEIRKLMPDDIHPLTEKGRETFQEGPWLEVKTILESLITLGLERQADRIEMNPTEYEANIVYFTRGKERMRFPISRQTFQQMVHYMQEYYFFFGFTGKELKGKEYIIKPIMLNEGEDTRVILDIDSFNSDTTDLFES
jgi:hypothetical protein